MLTLAVVVAAAGCKTSTTSSPATPTTSTTAAVTADYHNSEQLAAGLRAQAANADLVHLTVTCRPFQSAAATAPAGSLFICNFTGAGLGYSAIYRVSADGRSAVKDNSGV